jgi:hypothetical protein
VDPGDQMLSQKLLVDVGVSMFASENRSHHFFSPLGRHVRSRPSFRSFFILRMMLLMALEPGQVIVKGLSHAKLLVLSWWPVMINVN